MAMTGDRRIFIDTNVLTRATIVSAPLHELALRTLEHLWSEGHELWISRQVIREYIANATRPQSYSHPISPDLILAQMRRFQDRFQIADETAAVTKKLLELLGTIPMGGKQIHDANIVATMLSEDITSLLTHNVGDFERFSKLIKVIPLEPIS